MTLQIIVVKANSNKDFRGILECYEKQKDKWINVFNCECVFGKKGIVPYEKKMEGDTATPSGIYSLGFVFGYGDKVDTRMRYVRLTDEDKWIDDPEHPFYNHFIRGSTDAKSYEIMKRTDNLYKLGIVINYNTDPVKKNKGSALFIHIWKDRKTPTKGCIAIDEQNIESIIQWLDPNKRPVILIKQP